MVEADCDAADLDVIGFSWDSQALNVLVVKREARIILGLHMSDGACLLLLPRCGVRNGVAE